VNFSGSERTLDALLIHANLTLRYFNLK